MLDIQMQRRKETELEDDKPKDKKTLKKYIFLGLLLNAGIWSLVFLYLKLFPPTFTSTGGIRILGGEPGIDVSLPDGGRAAPYLLGEKPKEFQNPKKDYVYIASSPNIAEDAAAKLGIPIKKFGKPKITANEDSAIITFEIKGDSPLHAQQKAETLYETINKHIEQLRKTESERRENEIKVSLKGSCTSLEAAQKRLATYQNVSRFNSNEQIVNLSTNIEQLRRTRAELLAQKQDVVQRLLQLSGNLNKQSFSEAADAYKLQGDEVYNQYLKQYAQHSTSVADLTSRFTSENPQLIREKSILQGVAIALQKRGSFLLGKPVSRDVLMLLTTTTLDPQVKVLREELSKSLLSNQVDQAGITARIQGLDQQISQLEARMRLLIQEQFTVDKLKRDVQLAETTFASSVVKLNMRKENLYSVYPPVQLVVSPNLPKPSDPTFPSNRAAYLAGLGGCFIVTSGLILLWFNRHRREGDSSIFDKISRKKYVDLLGYLISARSYKGMKV